MVVYRRISEIAAPVKIKCLANNADFFLFQNYFKKAAGSVCFGSFFENIIFLIFFFFHIVFIHIRRFSLIRNLVPSVLFSEHFHFFPCRQSSDNLACADVGFCTYIDR